MRALSIFAVVIFLNGCSSMGDVGNALLGVAPTQRIPSPTDLQMAVRNTYRGRPFNYVLLRYGQPTGQVPFGELTVYQFRLAQSVRLQAPVSTTTTGTIGTYDANLSYSESTSGWQGYNQNMNCMMQVGVRPDGTVDDVGFVGQMGACQAFMP